MHAPTIPPGQPCEPGLQIPTPCLAIVGTPQVGTSTLASVLADEWQGPTHRFDLEFPSDLARLSEPELALSDLDGLIVLDEIQRRPELFPVLRALVDRFPGRRYLGLGSAPLSCFASPPRPSLAASPITTLGHVPRMKCLLATARCGFGAASLVRFSRQAKPPAFVGAWSSAEPLSSAICAVSEGRYRLPPTTGFGGCSRMPAGRYGMHHGSRRGSAWPALRSGVTSICCARRWWSMSFSQGSRIRVNGK